MAAVLFSHRSAQLPHPMLLKRGRRWRRWRRRRWQTARFFAQPVPVKTEGTAMTADYPYGYLPLGAETLAAGKAHETGDTVSP